MGGILAFWALVLPTACVVCGHPDVSLCHSCTSSFRRLTVRPYNAEEGALSLPWADENPDPCFESTPRVLPVIAAGRYGRQLADVLLAYKNKGHTDLADVLEAALAGVLHVAISAAAGAAEGGLDSDRGSAVRTAGPLLIVPVPSRAAALRKRGYDPVWLLLNQLRRRHCLPAGTVLLAAVQTTRRRATRAAAVIGWLTGSPSQKSLGRLGRSRNVSGVFAVSAAFRTKVRGKRCLIVDDVLTTGATMAEMVRVLREAGAEVIGGAVIAATAAPSGDGARIDEGMSAPLQANSC